MFVVCIAVAVLVTALLTTFVFARLHQAPFRVAKTIGVVAACLLVSLAAFGSFIEAMSEGGNYARLPFSQEAWRDEPGSRYMYADALVADHALEGRSELEIEALLGPADDSQRTSGERRDSYRLGMPFAQRVTGGASIMVIAFSEAGIVLDAYVTFIGH